MAQTDIFNGWTPFSNKASAGYLEFKILNFGQRFLLLPESTSAHKISRNSYYISLKCGDLTIFKMMVVRGFCNLVEICVKI